MPSFVSSGFDSASPPTKTSSARGDGRNGIRIPTGFGGGTRRGHSTERLEHRIDCWSGMVCSPGSIIEEYGVIMQTHPQIHLVWLGSPVPARVRTLANRLVELHPGLIIRIWTESELAWLSNHTEFLAEPRLSGKANIARYEIILRHGGVYLDADFAVHRPLDEVFRAVDQFGLVVARQSRALFNPAFIAARPGHPAMERAAAGIADSRRRFSDASSPARTGPHYLTSVLLEHVRSGGTFGEMPQHSIYPWHSDEARLTHDAVPRSVIVSHEWATMHGPDYWGRENLDPGTDLIPGHPRSRARVSLRARLASSPHSHEFIRRLEAMRFRGDASTRWLHLDPLGSGDSGKPEEDHRPESTPPSAAIEAWTARLIARSVRGSDGVLDISPASSGPFMTALRVLDRPGRAVLVVSSGVPPTDSWRDRSVRCSAHVLTMSTADPDRLVRIESMGSALLPREVSAEQGLLAFQSQHEHVELSRLVGSIPRFALVRCTAEALTPPLRDVFAEMLDASRIGTLVLTIDPLSVAPGVSTALDLIRYCAESGRSVSIGPWLVDGRGRAWDEHVRVAARPFVVSIKNPR
jgi:hypothetical protein